MSTEWGMIKDGHNPDFSCELYTSMGSMCLLGANVGVWINFWLSDDV